MCHCIKPQDSCYQCLCWQLGRLLVCVQNFVSSIITEENKSAHASSCLSVKKTLHLSQRLCLNCECCCFIPLNHAEATTQAITACRLLGGDLWAHCAGLCPALITSEIDSRALGKPLMESPELEAFIITQIAVCPNKAVLRFIASQTNIQASAFSLDLFFCYSFYLFIFLTLL